MYTDRVLTVLWDEILFYHCHSGLYTQPRKYIQLRYKKRDALHCGIVITAIWTSTC